MQQFFYNVEANATCPSGHNYHLICTLFHFWKYINKYMIGFTNSKYMFAHILLHHIIKKLTFKIHVRYFDKHIFNHVNQRNVRTTKYKIPKLFKKSCEWISRRGRFGRVLRVCRHLGWLYGKHLTLNDLLFYKWNCNGYWGTCWGTLIKHTIKYFSNSKKVHCTHLILNTAQELTLFTQCKAPQY